MADLEEYRGNRQSLQTLKSKNRELEKARIIISELRAELYKREYEWRVSEHEIQLVNTQLQRHIESAELCKLAKELVHQPSKYADMIRTMRERSELQSTLVN
jgi:molybdopterin converting factor small subunit